MALGQIGSPRNIKEGKTMVRRMAVLLAVCGVLVGVSVAMRPASTSGVKSDKENIVASRLEGKWRLHGKLSERLTGRKSALGMPARGFVFKNNPEVAKAIPEKYDKFLKGKQIFMAGTLRFLGMGTKEEARENPFILIQHRGNPHIVYFRERDGDPMGDAESFNVMLAVAKDSVKDLLFIGGDFNNQPFSAFERVPGSAGPEGVMKGSESINRK